MSQLTHDKEAAREAARGGDGKFGTQPAAESPTDLGAAPTGGCCLDCGQEMVTEPGERGSFHLAHDGTVDAEADADHEPVAPTWVQDGVTPHPTGGYVSVVEKTLDRPSSPRLKAKTRSYLNAEGRLHRLDGPAFVRTTATGHHEERYYQDRFQHRGGNRPSVLMWSPTGVVYHAEWHIDSEHDRTDSGPATATQSCVTWYEEGEPVIERTHDYRDADPSQYMSPEDTQPAEELEYRQ